MAGAKGTAEIDFGSFPGDVHATLNIMGQAGITISARVEVWLEPGPSGTTDHNADEHVCESAHLRFVATDVVDGVGFTIHGIFGCGGEPLDMPRMNTFRSVATTVVGGPTVPSVGGRTHRTHGKWKVGWVWAL